eukprot:CAMPEP_0198237806 /NCGR_PEP_ID=MMETSP1446-20131203/3599_1 /TAXON_ID=1461542 ORGANISM="Unidentified sp, Strain CCMP2111" /NCGR_SAMPLE_ID=MMETSP1446 /ASSEMBLY_ACC=CAM_ASM_001112 /LENGTH=60 /DNA_ID=CAMNT_0043920071 /DNA_START=442 /DNA_END=621 /DNA_ORIENTATION=-
MALCGGTSNCTNGKAEGCTKGEWSMAYRETWMEKHGEGWLLSLALCLCMPLHASASVVRQ